MSHGSRTPGGRLLPLSGRRRNGRLRAIHRHRLFRRGNGEFELGGASRLYGDGEAPVEVPRPLRTGKYWSRRGIAEWLVDRLAEDVPTLVGIDHGFSFPLAYFEMHGLTTDWPVFLDDFQRHWPTDDDNLRRLQCARASRATAPHARATRAGAGSARSAPEGPGRCFTSTRRDQWPRPPTQGCLGCASSGRNSAIRSVSGRSTDGMFGQVGRRSPRSIRHCGTRTSPERRAPGTSRTRLSIAAFLSRADADGGLVRLLAPDLTPEERTLAGVEGWILGVAGPAADSKTTPKAPDRVHQGHPERSRARSARLYEQERPDGAAAGLHLRLRMMRPGICRERRGHQSDALSTLPPRSQPDSPIDSRRRTSWLSIPAVQVFAASAVEIRPVHRPRSHAAGDAREDSL